MDDSRIVWLDMEMTGLDPNTNRIIEVAAAITDGHLNVECDDHNGQRYFHNVIFCPQIALSRMNAWCQKQHGESGLAAESLRSSIVLGEAERGLITWLKGKGFAPQTAILGGNSIHFDRRFIARWMPDLHEFLHYRMIDVSAIREIILRIADSSSVIHRHASASGSCSHRALDDVGMSIAEAEVYWDHMRPARIAECA